MGTVCRWLYLEPILSGEGGEPGARFRPADGGYRAVTRALEADARLSALVRAPRLQTTLDSVLAQLAACQQSLEAYIHEKRRIFPRFHFLSDDDLLELVGQARAGGAGREAALHAHLRKLFPGAAGLALAHNSMSVVALTTHHGDTLPLDTPVDIDAPVEIWLKKLEDEMRSSLKNAVLKCLLDKTSQYQDAFSFPTQVLCLAQNVRFTEQAERSIVSKELHKLKDRIDRECKQYMEVDAAEDEGERIKKRALILQCSYYLNVLQTLIDNNVGSTTHWLWQKQLRFYLLSNSTIVARMGLAQIAYSYEYLGIDTGQFVRTELTEKCFLILTQAFHLGLVGNPFGPAGTGKTESVKALGGLVGRLVLVFNCDEAMDARCMGRLLSGLALCGAWGCFDEFNRLTAETLGLISHQLASLLAAIPSRAAAAAPAHSRIALLNGKEVEVSDRCGVLATLNPAGRGYGGRRTLPAALARLLRPAAVTRAPAAPLAHHLLAARALHAPREVAYALAHVFSMAQDLLSWQQHYDWGLRALKTVVGSCGRAVEAARARNSGALSEDEQRAIVLRAARLNTMSKLTRADAVRFDAILSMAFPGVAPSEEEENDLDLALKDSYQALGLVYKKEQVQKCKELYEQLQQRMGVVIVGPPGSGKTTIRQLLKHALDQMGKNITEHVICPKAMSRSLLMGHIDHDTRQWTDGVISSTALEVSNQTADMWSWVVLDGDVEPEWVESLNSVLDDNRLLTLPSGWRVQFPPAVNFLLETHSLQHASPATVSRTAVVLLGDENSCAMETLETWSSRLDPDNEPARLALPLLTKTMNDCLKWSSSHRNEFVQTLYSVAIVKQVLVQFDFIVESLKNDVMSIASPEDIVGLAFGRGIVPALKPKAAEKFMVEVCGVLGGHAELSEGAEGEGWRGDVYLSRRLARAARALTAAARRSHVLVVGADACAKNILAEHVIKEENDKLLISIHCTPVLEPSNIIEELKRNKVIRTGSVRSKWGGAGGGGAGAGGGVVLLVKSLHRARVDAWGSSAVHAFLLQLIQYGGFWERVRGEGAGQGEGGAVRWSSVPGVQVVMTLTPGARALCPRLAGSAALAPIRDPDDEELSELAVACMSRSIRAEEISKDQVKKVTASMLMLFKEVSETFTSQPHYSWNTADLTRWCDNVQWYKPTNEESLLQAVHAEADCIFRNRLIDDTDTASFDSIRHRYIRAANTEGLYYSPKLHRDGVYMEPTDYNDWYQSTQKIINQCLSESEQNVFGESGAEVCSELATFCSAIARSVSGGLVVCAASAGAGRRAAARIVSTALPAALYSIRDPRDFYAQLKNALTSAGSESSKTIVVLEESAGGGAMLGAVEALARATALAHLPEQLQPSVTQRGDAHHTFMQNVKQNLGIVILLDQSDSSLPSLLDSYPLLYRRAQLVWTARWSAETLHRMPLLVVQRLMKENIRESTEEENDCIPIDGFVKVYSALRSQSMLAPCRYVNLVGTYYHINRTKKQALLKRQETLRAGVAALRAARSEVSTLKQDAARQQTLLSEKQQKATHALDQISATVTSATGHKEDMQALKRSIETENDKLQVRKREIEVELASVEPVIAAARAAVGDIRPEALSEVRSMRAPPDAVRDVLEGVLRLMGIADTSWHSMKNFLAKRGVKEDIRCMDASQITAESLASVERLLERRGASFEEKAARRASAACAPLAAWVRANVAYASALLRVRPLQLQQRELHKNLEDAEAQLVALSSGLQSVDERVAALKEQLTRYTKEGLEIEMKLNAAIETIAKTESLVDKLSEEYDTWERDLENISLEIGEINVRSLLAAAYIVYLSDVPEDQCQHLMEEWSRGLDFDATNFSVLNFLSSVEDQLKWSANGLPSDVSALKNAVIVDQALQSTKCGFTALIVDPDGDAGSWLRSRLAELPSDFMPQHSDKLATALQHAARCGKVLVLEQVTHVEERWAPLLRGLPLSAQPAPHPHCRLVLYSRDPTLPRRLHPAHRALLSVVDFTPKIEGLTDQLMNFALQNEKPEINENMNALKVQKASLQRQQHELQVNLLKDLSGNTNILQDAKLLSSLASTRSTSTTIAAALTEARTLEVQMRSMYDKFRASARRAAALLLAVREVSGSKYRLVSVPVDTLVSVYIEALDRGKVADDPDALDTEGVVKYVTSRVVERVVLSLHKQDKYTVILHLLRHVYEDHIPRKLWNIFIGSILSIDDGVVRDLKTKLSWIPEENIPAVANLKVSAPELFEKLKLNDGEVWKVLMGSGDLNSVARLNLTTFEKVLAVQAIRPESLYSALSALITSILGASGGWRQTGGVEGGARWAGVCAGAAAAGRPPRPVLLLGAHAADQLAEHAQRHKRNLIQVWVREEEAEWRRELEGALREAARGGAWVALQLGAAPLSDHLQTFITTFCLQPQQEVEFDLEFRLWVVSEEREIPPLIANTCVNVLLEAPEGVRNNVMQTLAAWGGAESQDVKVVRMLFCLALLHAVAQERRAYTPQGWSQWYEWEWGDVSAAYSVVTAGSACAAGLVEALYAGRVSRAPDAAALAALVHENLGEQTLAHAWTPRGLNTTLPFAKQLQVYNSVLNTFPLSDTPAQLGLAGNARAAWDKKAAGYVLDTLRDLNAAVSMNHTKEASASIKPILSLWRKLMSGSPFVKGDFVVENMSGGAADEGETWWGAVVRGEGSAAARAVRVVHRALAAAAARDSPADARALAHQVPEEWQVVWAGPELVARYVRELAHRAAAAARRLHEYKNGDAIPAEVDLRSVFSPRRLVAALRASAARALGCSPESLTLNAKWDVKPGGTEGVGCVVRGLQLEGAAWRGGGGGREGCLAPAAADAPPSVTAPPILLQYTQQKSGVWSGAAASGGCAELPVYGGGARDELLFRVRAPLAPDYAHSTVLLNAVALVVADV